MDMTPPSKSSMGFGNDQKGSTRTPPSSRCSPWKRGAAAAATAAALVSTALLSGCASNDPIDLLPASERMVIHHGKPETPVNEDDTKLPRNVDSGYPQPTEVARPLTVDEMLARVRNQSERTERVRLGSGQASAEPKEGISTSVLPGQSAAADFLLLRFRSGEALPNAQQRKLLEAWMAEHGQTPVRIAAGPDGDNRQWAAAAKAQKRANKLAELMRAKAIEVTLAYDPRIPINSVRISLNRSLPTMSPNQLN